MAATNIMIGENVTSTYYAKIVWTCGEADFKKGKYSRSHTWIFDGGVEVVASSSPHIVPVPFSNPAAIDPEEAFVASLSSCHMLWFLSIAAQNGFSIESYIDEPVGIMGRNEEGKVAMLSVTLRPHVLFSDKHIPSPQMIESLHEKAHSECFIASSVKTSVVCTPIFA